MLTGCFFSSRYLLTSNNPQIHLLFRLVIESLSMASYVETLHVTSLQVVHKRLRIAIAIRKSKLLLNGKS